MAASTQGDDELMTSINVTPLVDITLVLLVVLMITASYMASKTIPMELPKGQTGEDTPTMLAVSIGADGTLFHDATEVSERDLRLRIRAAASSDPETRAIIAADGMTAHAQVVRVIDILRQEHVTKFAINIDPEDLEPR